MLIETAYSLPSGELAKKQFSLDDIRTHEADPVTGRSVMVVRAVSPISMGGTVRTWEAKATLDARLLTLSADHPVALMSEEDWAAAQSAHGG